MPTVYCDVLAVFYLLMPKWSEFPLANNKHTSQDGKQHFIIKQLFFLLSFMSYVTLHAKRNKHQIERILNSLTFQ